MKYNFVEKEGQPGKGGSRIHVFKAKLNLVKLNFVEKGGRQGKGRSRRGVTVSLRLQGDLCRRHCIFGVLWIVDSWAFIPHFYIPHTYTLPPQKSPS